MLRPLVVSLLLIGASAGAAQEVQVPVDVQAPIFLKVLSFDRKLKDHQREPLRIGILYQPRNRSSRDVYESFRRAVEKSGISSIGERNISLLGIEADDEEDVIRKLTSAAVDVLYVTPLRAVRISAITEITRQRGITTLTGVSDYVAAGLTVGLDVRGQKPQIVVNVAAQKAEGADFSSQLLKMARIVE